MTTGRCRDCGAPVRWVKTSHGKNMPLDPSPTRDGNVLLASTPAMATSYSVPLGTGVVLKAGAIVAEQQVGTQLYTAHFATCPKRRPRK